MKETVNVGDKYKEKLPSWVKSKTGFFSWVYQVVAIEDEFAYCIRICRDGKLENLRISIELLTDGIFYKKI